jgi:hypothetical protein
MHKRGAGRTGDINCIPYPMLERSLSFRSQSQLMSCGKVGRRKVVAWWIRGCTAWPQVKLGASWSPRLSFAQSAIKVGMGGAGSRNSFRFWEKVDVDAEAYSVKPEIDWWTDGSYIVVLGTSTRLPGGVTLLMKSRILFRSR